MIEVMWLGEIAWKGTVILAASFAASALLRRASAAARHFLWTAVFAALLLLPLAISVAPPWAVQSPLAVTVPAAAVSQTTLTVRPDPAQHSRSPWIFLWGLGCVLTATRFLLGAARAYWIVRRARPADYAQAIAADLGSAAAILESANAPVPLACGLLRPAVVLPAGAAAWSEARLRTVLLHEIAHIRRWDLGTQALGQAACCLYWFQPLAWLAARRLRQEREQACDDAVLASGTPAHEYASDLVDLARGLASRRRAWADAPAMAESSDLESRVRALFDSRRSRRPLRTASAAPMAALALAVLLPVATLKVHAQISGGALAGVVQDASGARVPNCRVVAKNQDGSNQEMTRANAAGEYQFGAIPAGNYVLEFAAPGFALKRMEATVTPGQAARLDASLEMGAVSEMITVRGQKPPTVAPRTASAPQRIRVGGNVQPVRLLRQTKPQYPAELQQLGIEGTVIMRGVISKDGEVLSPKVVNTVDSRLAQLALDAFKQWRYQPSLLNGQPVETVTTVTIDFTLN